ncbi:MAG: glycoside hydrolase family 97 N-terminal domain-containing protein, partial [Proteiniphilum sp.]
CSSKTDFAVSSPDDKITAIVKYDKEQGTVHYIVQSRKQEIISSSSMGISTSLGDFTSGMKLKGSSTKTIDETYHLPQGKVSTYRNHANEQTLTFSKNGQQLNILFRVYNDGIAYRYEIPGEGNIEFSGESSSINLADTNLTYYGQNHPNRYGYESALGPIDGELMSNPVLAHLKDKNHFILMGQAATYGNYVQTHFQRSGNRFTYSYPLDQEKIGSVHSTLPFQSPWRMAIISPENPGKIVESYMVENLNPPTKPVYLNQDGSIKDWVKPGRVMWDFIARDGDKPRMWIDAVKEMGWEYYMADAGFANRWGGSDSVLNVVEYAEDKGIGVIGWAHTREFDTREKADSTMGRYADWGLKGAKIDFFDNNTLSENPRDWRDYEDTQQSLQMRDWIFDLGIEYSFLLELHGNTIPTGERRQYPNLMTLEGVDGMERRTKPASNDLTIPYVRNVMGPVSYTVIHFERSPGTHAYQLAMPIVYEAGLMIYAEHGKKLLDWPGREMIKDIPSTWDETKYLEGMPAGHIVIARRKGADWYIGGMTDEARTVEISLNFLNEGKKYHALIFNDDTHTTMKKETRLISSNDTLSLNLLERGGFALRIRPE